MSTNISLTTWRTIGCKKQRAFSRHLNSGRGILRTINCRSEFCSKECFKLRFCLRGKQASFLVVTKFLYDTVNVQSRH